MLLEQVPGGAGRGAQGRKEVGVIRETSPP